MPRSYGDLVALASLIAMLASVVMWGVSLEQRNNQLRDQILEIKSELGNGTLPRVEQRLKHIEMDVQRIYIRLDGI